MKTDAVTPTPLVLIVQSDAGRRSAYAEALERWGLRVAQAETAQLGLRAAWELGPDVIAVDVAGLGLEASRFLRGLWGVPATARIPLVRFCETASGPAAEAPNDSHVVLAPGCLPEQLFAAIEELVGGTETPPHAPANGQRRVRMPRVEPPFTRRKADRRGADATD
jgi:DNA-binding NarL/FixJ family response regulator